MKIISVVPIDRKSRMQKYTRTYTYTIKSKSPAEIMQSSLDLNSKLFQITQDA